MEINDKRQLNISGEQTDSCYFEGTVLDVIRSRYPEAHEFLMLSNYSLEGLFSEEEWYDILQQSRSSYEEHLKNLENK